MAPIKLIPTHVTSEEGGEWKVYTEQGFTKEDMAQAVRPSIISAEICNTIILLAERPNGYRFWIHAMKFSDEAEWDVYNGWR